MDCNPSVVSVGRWRWLWLKRHKSRAESVLVTNDKGVNGTPKESKDISREDAADKYVVKFKVKEGEIREKN